MKIGVTTIFKVSPDVSASCHLWRTPVRIWADALVSVNEKRLDKISSGLEIEEREAGWDPGDERQRRSWLSFWKLLTESETFFKIGIFLKKNKISIWQPCKSNLDIFQKFDRSNLQCHLREDFFHSIGQKRGSHLILKWWKWVNKKN